MKKKGLINENEIRDKILNFSFRFFIYINVIFSVVVCANYSLNVLAFSEGMTVYKKKKIMFSCFLLAWDVTMKIFIISDYLTGINY